MACKSKRHIYKENIRTAGITRGKTGLKGSSRIGRVEGKPECHPKNPTSREPVLQGKPSSSEQFSTDLLPISCLPAAFHAIKHLYFPGISKSRAGQTLGSAAGGRVSSDAFVTTHIHSFPLENGTKSDCHAAFPSLIKQYNV